MALDYQLVIDILISSPSVELFQRDGDYSSFIKQVENIFVLKEANEFLDIASFYQYTERILLEKQKSFTSY